MGGCGGVLVIDKLYVLCSMSYDYDGDPIKSIIGASTSELALVRKIDRYVGIAMKCDVQARINYTNHDGDILFKASIGFQSHSCANEYTKQTKHVATNRWVIYTIEEVENIRE